MPGKSSLEVLRLAYVYYFSFRVVQGVYKEHVRLRVRQLADLPTELRAVMRDNVEACLHISRMLRPYVIRAEI